MKQEIIDLLLKKRKTINDLWMKIQLEDELLREDLMSDEEFRSQSEELAYALINAMKEGTLDIESSAYDQALEIITAQALSRAKQGYSPRETGMYILSLKEALFKFLAQELKANFNTHYDDLLALNKLIDTLSIVSFETFIKGREEVILRQTDEIVEISTPVIRVWEGIVALPIIGTLDSARTQVVMESLLQEIVDTGSSIAILDISGVPAVDSLVAQHLMKTVSATRLMGAECIISGIRPEIAQTIVHLGIDLTNIYTKSSLASALRFAFQYLNLNVIKTGKPNA